MKQVFILIIILSLFVGSCSKKGSTSEFAEGEVVTLQFWSLFGGGENYIMEEIVKEFNEQEEHIDVKITLVEWAEYYTKLFTAVSADSAPDIGISHLTKLPELIYEGAVVPLDKYAEYLDIEWDSFNQSLLSASTDKGSHYAIPIDTHLLVMYYNRDILEQYHFLDSSGELRYHPDSSDSFWNLLEELKETLPKEIAPLVFMTGSNWLWWALYKQHGGVAFITSDGSALDKSAMIRALEDNKRLFDEGYIPLNIDEPAQLFEARKAALLFDGVWRTASLEPKTDINFGVTTFPLLAGETPYTWGDSHTLILPYSSQEDIKRRISAIKFMNFVADSGAAWSVAGHVPAKPGVISSPQFQALRYRKDYAEGAKRVIYLPYHQKVRPAFDVVDRHLDPYLLGQVSAEETYNIIEKEINSLLNR